jgi:REP element-mobilizing transposase RayT
MKARDMWNKRRLPRLPPEYYQGQAHVHWTHVSQARRRIGWNAEMHAYFREVLLHTCARYHLGCARYVCMPDHLHLIWVGACAESDQLKATRFLRRHVDLTWQKQAHDHVLRESERERGAFSDACQYLRDNPLRAGLVSSAEEWPFAGSMVPGFPDLDPWDSDQFWKCLLAYRAAHSPA